MQITEREREIDAQLTKYIKKTLRMCNYVDEGDNENEINGLSNLKTDTICIL